MFLGKSFLNTFFVNWLIFFIFGRFLCDVFGIVLRFVLFEQVIIYIDCDSIMYQLSMASLAREIGVIKGRSMSSVFSLLMVILYSFR